ncbi:MAG TPA: DUF3892 domain-containing protein [Thermoanaerobaculia bacterium]|jgi:hypothetical protein
MATRHPITCIVRGDGVAPHERIVSVGGIDPEGYRWRLSQREVIAGIESGKWSFHVAGAETNVRIVVAVGIGGEKYLKGEIDGEQPDSLLRLPECRATPLRL